MPLYSLENELGEWGIPTPPMEDDVVEYYVDIYDLLPRTSQSRDWPIEYPIASRAFGCYQCFYPIVPETEGVVCIPGVGIICPV